MAKKTTENTENKNAHGIVYPQRLLSLRKAAAYLDRSQDSLRDLIYKGTFPVVQLGERSKMWLDINDLDNWISNNKQFLREA
jgi:predicted DNA-binding transcriptional regulator AlpA